MDLSVPGIQMTLAVIALFVMVAMAIYWLVSKREARRSELMRQLAVELNWECLEESDGQFFRQETFAGLTGIERTTGSRAQNILHGTLQVTRRDGSVGNFPTWAGDYWAQPPSAHERGTSKLYSFVLVELPNHLAGELLIRRNGYCAAGENRVNVPHVPDESREDFVALSEDESFAKRILTKEVIDHLLSGPRYFVQLSNQHLYLSRQPPRMTPNEWHRCIAWIRELLASLDRV